MKTAIALVLTTVLGMSVAYAHCNFPMSCAVPGASINGLQLVN